MVTAAVILRYDNSILSTTVPRIAAGDLWPDATVRAVVNEATGDRERLSERERADVIKHAKAALTRMIEITREAA